METKIPQEWNKFYLKDVTFINLMRRRIYNVLIVANPYDAFMLEDDGRVEEKYTTNTPNSACAILPRSPKCRQPRRRPRCLKPPMWTW